MSARKLGLLAACIAVTTLASARELAGRVVSVQDGDTLTVLVSQKQIKVRLTEIDAPERKQPFGTRSRQSLADLCAGKDARVAEQGKDRYGRTLGASTAPGWTLTRSRCGAAWPGCMSDTLPKTRRCTRCNWKRRLSGADCGRMLGQCRLGSGASASRSFREEHLMRCLQIGIAVTCLIMALGSGTAF